MSGLTTGTVLTLTTEPELDDFFQQGACYFTISSGSETWLCTSSEDGDLWALRFASEEDETAAPVLALIDDLPLPWEVVVIS